MVTREEVQGLVIKKILRPASGMDKDTLLEDFHRMESLKEKMEVKEMGKDNIIEDVLLRDSLTEKGVVKEMEKDIIIEGVLLPGSLMEKEVVTGMGKDNIIEDVLLRDSLTEKGAEMHIEIPLAEEVVLSLDRAIKGKDGAIFRARKAAVEVDSIKVAGKVTVGDKDNRRHFLFFAGN